MIPYAEHTENLVKQSDFFPAVSVVCVHTGTFVQQSDLIAAVNPVLEQTVSYAEHTENSVLHPCFFAVQFLHFDFFDRRSAFHA